MTYSIHSATIDVVGDSGGLIVTVETGPFPNTELRRITVAPDTDIEAGLFGLLRLALALDDATSQEESL